MKRLFLALMLLPMAALAAGSATVSWTLPTQNTDGTPLTNLAEIRIYQAATCAAISLASTPTRVPAPGTSIVLTGYADGSTLAVVATAANTLGAESAPTGCATKTFPATPKVPSPPSGISLAVQQTTAYKMRQAVDGFQMVAIGSVAAGTQCDSRTVDGFNVVPRAAVTMASKFDTLPLVVFAKCG